MKAVIFGAGQNGLQVYHILKHDPSVEVVGFLDGNPERHGKTHCGLPILGDLDLVPELVKREGVEAGIAAIGDNRIRAKISKALGDMGLMRINAIHPQTIIDDTVRLGKGVIVEMGVAIHPLATVGDCVFIGGSTVIAHHSIVGDNVLLGGGVIFGGDVQIGENSLIGVGAVLQPHVRIGKNVIVGIGAAVINDLPDNAVAVGVPAKIIRYVEQE